jgi:hypothetical protein
MSEKPGHGSNHIAEAERLMALGRLDDAESELGRVATGDHAYRAACLLLIHIAQRRGEVTFRTDHLLQDFLSTPPLDENERVALRVLAKLYDGQGHDDLAGEVRALIETASPVVKTALPDLPPLPAPRAPGHAASPQTTVRVEPSPPSATSASQASTLPMGDAAHVWMPEKTEGSKTGVWASIVESIEPPEPEGVTPTPPATPAATPRQRPSSATQSASSESGRSAYQIGAIVNDRYEILEQLGRGGMATVYRVFDRELDEAVALKLFLQRMTDDDGETDVARFKRELKLARRLRHPNIVQLFDLGNFAMHYYITLELLDGEDLHRVLRRQRAPWAVKDVVALAMQICAGLDAAHAIGVIHRDIKPANIFVPSSGPLKIMDFGIAKGGQDASDMATKTGMMMGTPQYMAPEQAQDAARVGPESDLYALGVILFELLCGRRPFDGTNMMAVLVDVVTKPPPDIRTLRADLPADLADLVMGLLQKAPEARPRSAKEVAQALTGVR